jgi:hypothetical protein
MIEGDDSSRVPNGAPGQGFAAAEERRNRARCRQRCDTPKTGWVVHDSELDWGQRGRPFCRPAALLWPLGYLVLRPVSGTPTGNGAGAGSAMGRRRAEVIECTLHEMG